MIKISDLQGMAYLKNKLNKKKTRVILRYDYYQSKYHVDDFGISTPDKLKNKNSRVGWCSKAVDSLADRLVVNGFENDVFDMKNSYDMNSSDILFNSAILSALISSCCFIYIAPDENGFPQMQVIDGANATGIIDPITYMLKEGYAVLDTDKNGKPTLEAYFTNEYTLYYEKGKDPYTIDNPTDYPLLVPIINRPDARRPFGHSRISRSCMSYVQSASRTIKRSEISAEFYSYPQKYATGLADDIEIDKWRASISTMMTFSKDEDGDSPSLGQFSQQSMEPHNSQLKMFASLFAGETGLTVDDLGFVTDNPSSSEAIKASHENLRLMARKAQRDFAIGFINAGYLAACLRDRTNYSREIALRTIMLWKPIFEPDSSMLSSIGDGIIKVNQAIPGYFNKSNVEKLTGIESNQNQNNNDLEDIESDGS